jgi:phosphoglycolate phosphatase
MARLRERAGGVLREAGLTTTEVDRALDAAWHAPDPVESAHPLTDLPGLFGRLRAAGCRVAVATSDDRAPTERTLAALGVDHWVDAYVCADDGLPVKPEPDMVVHLCREIGVEPSRTAVVGDSVADLSMGRAAGARLVVGVLTGVGGRDELTPLADVVIASIAELATD